MARAILTLNAGSSSIKFGLYERREPAGLAPVASGALARVGTVVGPAPHFLVRDAAGATLVEARLTAADASQGELFGRLLDWIEGHLGTDALLAVGHRIVHGGRDFTAPVRLDERVLAALAKLAPLAPLHQPLGLAPIRAIWALRPDLPQAACFDTAFHRSMPAVATRFALPRSYEAEGVCRYGFHGLSYEYIAQALAERAPPLARGRVVVAHLGSGASLCAMRNGESVETTMGLTALDGLMMATRCGTLDAGVVLYMLQEKRMSAAAIEDVLYRHSGLLGVSGISSDMQVLLASGDPRAREAIELFVFRTARAIAALTGSLGGLDGLVFTAGIGENAAEVRSAVCERLSWLGVVLDSAANARRAALISRPESKVEVRIIPTNEELMIARHTLEALGAEVASPGPA